MSKKIKTIGVFGPDLGGYKSPKPLAKFGNHQEDVPNPKLAKVKEVKSSKKK